MHDQLKYHLEKADLYGLLAKKYEYVDPEKHMHFYHKHFCHVQKVEHYYKMMHHRKMPWRRESSSSGDMYYHSSMY